MFIGCADSSIMGIVCELNGENKDKEESKDGKEDTDIGITLLLVTIKVALKDLSKSALTFTIGLMFLMTGIGCISKYYDTNLINLIWKVNNISNTNKNQSNEGETRNQSNGSKTHMNNNKTNG